VLAGGGPVNSAVGLLNVTRDPMCPRAKVEFLICGVASMIGAFWFLLPETAQRFDRMAVFFRNPEMHKVWVRGFGLILLCIAAASLLAALIDLFSSC
jgi:hypothetical protein